MSTRRIRIVCATDLLPRSDAAMLRAGLLAQQVAADLTLLHVVPSMDPGRALEESLHEAQFMLRDRARPPAWPFERLPDTAVRAGSPARLIRDGVAGADLLVLGPHRRRPLRDALEGTIAEKVLAARACAVLMVRTGATAAYQRVMLALDLSASSIGAVRAAEELVLPEGAMATIVHADDPPFQGLLDYADVSDANVVDYIQGWRSEVRQGLRGLLRRESADPSRYDVHVEARSTVRGILRAVDQFGPDLLVMGTRGGGRLHRALLGSVANRVVHDVACDVLVVPAGSFPALRPRAGTMVDPRRARPDATA